MARYRSKNYASSYFDDEDDYSWFGEGRVRSMVDTVAESGRFGFGFSDSGGARISQNGSGDKTVSLTNPKVLRDNGLSYMEALDVSLYTAGHEGAHHKLSDHDVLGEALENAKKEGFDESTFNILIQGAEDARVDADTSSRRPGFAYMRQKALASMMKMMPVPDIRNEDGKKLAEQLAVVARTFGLDLRTSVSVPKHQREVWGNAKYDDIIDRGNEIGDKLLSISEASHSSKEVIDGVTEVYREYYEVSENGGNSSDENEEGENNEEGEGKGNGKGQSGKGEGNGDNEGDSDESNGEPDDGADSDGDSDGDSTGQADGQAKSAQVTPRNSNNPEPSFGAKRSKGSNILTDILPPEVKKEMEKAYEQNEATREHIRHNLNNGRAYPRFNLRTKAEREEMERTICVGTHADVPTAYQSYLPAFFREELGIEPPSQHRALENKSEDEAGQDLVYPKSAITEMLDKFATQVSAGRMQHLFPPDPKASNPNTASRIKLSALEGMAVQLASKLREALRAAKTEHGYTSDNGTIQANRAYRATMVNDGRVFDKPDYIEEGGYVVDLILDQSGSTSSIERDVRAQSFVIARALSLCGIPHRISTFHTEGSTAVTGLLRDYDDDKTHDLACFAFSAQGSNRDGLSILMAEQFIKQRPEAHKLMIVMSDGSPAASAGHGVRGLTSYGTEKRGYGTDGAISSGIIDVNQIVRRIRNEGIALFGVYVESSGRSDSAGLEREKNMYGNEFAYANNINNFVPTVGNILTRYILKFNS